MGGVDASERRGFDAVGGGSFLMNFQPRSSRRIQRREPEALADVFYNPAANFSAGSKVVELRKERE